MGFFHLDIEDLDGGSFSVCEKGHPQSVVAVSFNQSPNFQVDLTNLRGRGSEGPQLYKNQEPVATRIGEELFTTFFPDSIRQRFEAYRNKLGRPRLALHLPRSLFALPWEVLKSPDDRPGRFISLMGSIVRCDAFAKDSAGLLELVQKNRLKFLAVSSNPKDRAILGELSWRSSKQIRFQKVAPATFEKFKSNIRATSDCDGFIFWGHGDFDPQTFVGKLVFLRPLSFKNLSRYESDPRDAFDIALAFEEKNSLRLGYILACESAFWGEGKVNFGYSIVGSLLDRTSLGFVVGAQTNLDVNAAELCIEASMSAIRADPPFPLDLAITEGRRGIRGIPSKDGQKYSALDWWVPVAYAKPSFLDEIEKAELPSDPADVRVPTPGITATASPSGGLAAAHSIGSFGAFANIATNSVRNLFS